MKPQPIIKPTNGDRSSFLSSLGPSIIQPIKGKRKILPQNDFSIDSIRQSSKSNQQFNETLEKLLHERESLLERIDSLEGEVIRNQDLIANTRQQLSLINLSNQSEIQNYSENQSEEIEDGNFYQEIMHNDREEHNNGQLNIDIGGSNENNENNYSLNATEPLSIDQIIEKALILQPFLHDDVNLDSFFDTFNSLQTSEKIEFTDVSINQLQKIALCNDSFIKCKEYVESPQFVEVFQSRTQNIFRAYLDDISIFLYDPKSKEYSCTTKTLFMQVPLTQGNSILGDILAQQKPEIVTNPLQHPSYSSRIDKPFNPQSQPFLAFPIDTYALVMVRMNKEPFKYEDVLVAQFYSKLVVPLFNVHIQHINLFRQVEFRRIIHNFEVDLSEKNTFESLLTYLLASLSDYVGANDANLYIVNKDSFFTYEIEADQIVKKDYQKSGIIESIVNNKCEVEVEKLNKDTCPSYNESIDNWAFDKSYFAHPIFSNSVFGFSDKSSEKNQDSSENGNGSRSTKMRKGKAKSSLSIKQQETETNVSKNNENAKHVIGVLCVSDKSECNKFNKWDIDLIRTICNTLSLVIPECIKNDSALVESSDKAAAKQFTQTIKSFIFKTMEEPNSIEIIAKAIQSSINCEWLSIYTTHDISSEITKLITLHNDTVVDTNFLDPSFIRMTFSKHEAINTPDPQQLDGFKTIGDITSHAFLCGFNFENSEKMGIFVMNSKSGDSKFPEAFNTILPAIAGFIIISKFIRNQNQTISDGKSATMTMSNAFNICNSLLNDPDPLPKLLDVLKELLSLEYYSVLRINKLKSEFDSVIRSEECPKGHISSEDILTSHFGDLKNPMLINDFSLSDYCNSAIIDFFPSIKQLLICPIIENELYGLFAGKNIVSNYALLYKYFYSLIRIFYKTSLLDSEVKIVESAELNKIDFYNSKFTSDDIDSLSFDSQFFNNSQKEEILLKIFDKLSIVDTLETNVEQLAIFLLKVRQSYNDVPYHNYSHAVDVVQFLYFFLIKLSDVFSPVQQASIIIAGLLHDVFHEGLDSEFLKKSYSPFVYSYGEVSTLEHHHLSSSISILQDHLIFDQSDIYYNQIFWDYLTKLILATDITQTSKFIMVFHTFENDFNLENENHKLILAKLLIQIANISTCFRPFEISQKYVEALLQEINTQNEEAKSREIPITDIKPIKEFEISFIDEVAKPLIQCLIKIFPDFSVIEDKLNSNRESWDNYQP
ncbi:hypothetical protein TRFO_19023 [Tritrichomonas foetus]|uniref:PDEase domain-containing protein n=1 Tax=Tritrichomonas foetus TaxID=1144522 RepID=A0A1J4KJI7_9EUKA|nr:hypothetical protein TRFO_19023 [Tritrichomonas foetus]|eukprot:OHT11487.1 hypothetical protein TRFO_19023 [Tritrichomonas foetus]